MLVLLHVYGVIWILFKQWCLFMSRDGVSEGQFYQVLLYELDAIRKVRIHQVLISTYEFIWEKKE